MVKNCRRIHYLFKEQESRSNQSCDTELFLRPPPHPCIRDSVLNSDFPDQRHAARVSPRNTWLSAVISAQTKGSCPPPQLGLSSIAHWHWWPVYMPQLGGPWFDMQFPCAECMESKKGMGYWSNGWSLPKLGENCVKRDFSGGSCFHNHQTQ